VIEVVAVSIERMFLRLRGLRGQIQQPAGIMRTLAEGVELQTRTRIHIEKRAPDGTPWAPWSARYARTRNTSRHSLLKDSWSMVDDDMRSSSTATTATVKNVAPYAAIHQGGSVFGPLRRGRGRATARPFLGLSDANVSDIERWLAPALEQLTQETLGGGKA
jgi:phage virion morphogenesis protein